MIEWTPAVAKVAQVVTAVAVVAGARWLRSIDKGIIRMNGTLGDHGKTLNRHDRQIERLEGRIMDQ